MDWTRPQLEVFRDALVDAFHNAVELDLFATATGQVASLEIDVGGGPLKVVAFNFLLHAQARGGLDRVLEVAIERRPGNPKLMAFAASAGATRVAGAVDLLNTHSFDLRPLEATWRKALSVPQKRLVVFVLCGAEQNVVGNVVERLRAHVGQPASTNGPRHTLDPKLAPIEKTVDLIAKLRSRLASNGIVCMVDAHEADQDAIDQVLDRLWQIYADALAHHLVLLLNIRRDGKVPAPCVQLPLPQFLDTDLYEWVEDVTRDKGWPEPLRDEFKLWLHEAADKAQSPTTDVAYFALEGAIDLLRRNPSVAALRERFKTPL